MENMGLLDASKIGYSRRTGHAVAAAAVTATLALGLAACGDGDDGPSVPDDAVAVVGEDKITPEEVERQAAAMQRAQPKAADGKKDLERQAVTTLLLSTAIEQEAAERGIEVSDAEIEKRWDSLTHDQFRGNEKLLRRFLNGQTKQDVLRQLRLQALNEQILADVMEKAGGGAKGTKAVQEFQEEFQERWSKETACREDQPASLCPER